MRIFTEFLFIFLQKNISRGSPIIGLKPEGMRSMDSNPGALESSDLGLSNAQGFELISLTVASECLIENSLFLEK